MSDQVENQNVDFLMTWLTCIMIRNSSSIFTYQSFINQWKRELYFSGKNVLDMRVDLGTAEYEVDSVTADELQHLVICNCEMVRPFT